MICKLLKSEAMSTDEVAKRLPNVDPNFHLLLSWKLKLAYHELHCVKLAVAGVV
jgi:hypothetical protein